MYATPPRGEAGGKDVPTPRSRNRRLGELRLIRETAFPAPENYPREPIRCRSAHTVYELMRPYVEREHAETFWILALDTQLQVIHGAPVAITRGTLDASLVHAREVFRSAVVAGASTIILVHNHPSGDPTPSAEDRAVTRTLHSAGDLIGIPIQDHVIIGDGRYCSFSEHGLL